ncbi:MAG: TerB family tellurite resistance protein [Povalibacter sp.]
MLEQLKKIFGNEPPAAGLLNVREPLDLAIAALLIELSRADFSESPAELDAIRQLLARRFGLSDETVEDLIARAIQRADRAVSLHEFTHRLNSELPESDKFAIVEMLWQVSHADGQIDKHEEHLIRRIAGLLHVSDRDRIRLKLKTIVG